MHSIENLVFAEVQDRLETMSGMKATDEECKATADLTLKFIDRTTKMAEVENQKKANELKEKELDESRKKRRWDFAKEIVEVTVTAGFTFVGAVWLTNYERTDSTVSTATRELWKQGLRIK